MRRLKKIKIAIFKILNSVLITITRRNEKPNKAATNLAEAHLLQSCKKVRVEHHFSYNATSKNYGKKNCLKPDRWNWRIPVAPHINHSIVDIAEYSEQNVYSIYNEEHIHAIIVVMPSIKGILKSKNSRPFSTNTQTDGTFAKVNCEHGWVSQPSA